MRVLTDLLLASADSHQPKFTFYDATTGDRTELSARSLGNWAAKCANMLRDEFAVGPDDQVALALPAHWQTAGILLGAWWVGAQTTLVSAAADAPADAVVAFATADRLDEIADAPEQLAVSTHPFGLPLSDLPLGVSDYSSTVRVHGDLFSGGVTPTEPLPGVAAAALPTPEGSARVVDSRPWETATAVRDGFVLPLLGGSLVYVAHASAADSARIAATEKATPLG